jgi:CRP-like cAMP-binding protein/HEAT repeat protein
VQNQLSVESISWVKEAALRALGALTNGDSFSQLREALNERDDHSLRGALIGILKYGNESAAQQKLIDLLTSDFYKDRILAIEVLGEVKRREFYPHLISACDSRETSRAAGHALVSVGTDALPEIEAAFLQPDALGQPLFVLTKALGYIGGTRSHNILLSRMSIPDEELRSQILSALSQSGYRTTDISTVQHAVKAEVEQAAWRCAAQVDLGEANETALLIMALEESLGQIRNRVLLLLSFVFNSDSIGRAREAFLAGSVTQVSYALEILDTQLPVEWKGWVMPLLEEIPPRERSLRLAAFLPQGQARQTPEERLCAILENNNFSFWVRACAAYTDARLFPAARKGDPVMLSTVEKVLILKTVSMFSQTPDNVLADVADLLEEIDVSENETIFRIGDLGDSMYIIVDGKVRVHTEERLLNYLGESDVFGEMALLDPEPRLASVTAVEPTRLFRLDQSPFYQLMTERPEVATGIIRVLSRHLRKRVHDLSQLESRVQGLERASKQQESTSV